MHNFKINDIVKYKKSLFPDDKYIIVGDKKKTWTKATPFVPSGTKLIYVEEGKDFILLKQKGKKFGLFGLEENGLHVKKGEIEFVKKYYNK